MSAVHLKDFSWERIKASVDAVHERALRASKALEKSSVAYVMIGGNAVAAWVSRVDLEAVRNTKDVDLLISRNDFEKAKTALQEVGFVHQNLAGTDVFLDGPKGSVRSAIHIVYAGEKVLPEHPLPAPNVSESESGPDYQIAKLDALVLMKLNAFRLKDQVHLMDLMDVGLIDSTWVSRFPKALADRLKQVIETRRNEGS
jgi:hypothetical protein